MEGGAQAWPRLAERLDRAVARKLTLVAAAPGYGKTTAVAGWADGHRVAGRRVAWLSVEESESDPVLFWRYVVAALRGAGSTAGAELEHVLRVPGTDLERAVGLLSNDLAAEDADVVLVLDDLHLAGDDEVVRLLGRFLAWIPDRMRVLVATRTDPALGLASLRAAGELDEVREDELQLTAEEARRLLDRHAGRPVPEADVAALVHRTEGWAAALQLAGQWLRGHPGDAAALARFSGRHRHLVDYLGEQVLAGLDGDLEAFLLRTAPLGRFSAGLCDAVTGGGDARAMIERIERARLFLVPLDDRREWFRYHHLFAELLRAELERREPGAAAEVHRNASAWHRAHGTTTEALRHAGLTGEATLVGAVLGDTWLTLLRSGRSQTVLRTLRGLPGRGLADAPQLGVVGAMISGVAGTTPDEVRRWLDVAERAAEDADRPLLEGTTLATGVAVVRAIFLCRDVPGGIRDATELAYREGPGHQAWHGVVAALAFLRYVDGDRDGAASAAADVLDDRDAPRRIHAAVQALATRSFLLLDAGDQPAATEAAQRALSLADACGISENVSVGLPRIALGRALAVAGDPAAGQREIRSGVALVEGRAPAVHGLYGLVELAEASHAAGDALAAHRALDAAVRVAAGFADTGGLGTRLARAQQRLRDGRRRRPATAGSLLTETELTVLRLLAGHSNREIADALSLSPNTVKSHVSAIYRKLDVHGRAEAHAAGVARGLLPR